MDGPLLRFLFLVVCAGSAMVVGFCGGGALCSLFRGRLMADQILGAFLGALVGVLLGSVIGIRGNRNWSGRRRVHFALASLLAVGIALGIVVLMDRHGLW